MCRQLVVTRREVKRFVALSEAESPRAAPSFRPLTEVETESTLGDDLLASLTHLAYS